MLLNHFLHNLESQISSVEDKSKSNISQTGAEKKKATGDPSSTSQIGSQLKAPS